MESLQDDLSPFDLAMGAANKLDPPADFDGPVKQRRVTDPLCLIFLLANWGITSLIGVWSLQNGDTLIHPVDYKGRICGVDKRSNGQLLPSYWYPVDALSSGVCVDECPIASMFEPTSKSQLICKDVEDLLTMDGCALSGAIVATDLSVLVTCGGCMFQTESKQLNDYCNPVSVSSLINKVNEIAVGQGKEALEGWKNFEYASYIQRLVRDLRTSFPIIAGAGFGGAVFFGFIFLLMARYPACIAPITWTSAALLPAVLGGAGTFLFFLADVYKLDQSGMHSNFRATSVLILAYIAWSFAGIMLFSVVILRKKISRAISITKAATRAISEVTFVPLFPIVQTIVYAVMIGCIAFWFLMLAASRSSAEEEVATATVYGYELSYYSQTYTVIAHYM